MNKKLILAGGLAAALIAAVLTLVLQKPQWKPQNNIICIDAGHGGTDPGAVSGERQEKDDNLALALLVARELEARGCVALLTRDGDAYPELSERCDIANKASSSLFISLHRNSAEGAKGVEVWVASKPSDIEKALAKDILAGLDAAGVQRSRGVKKGTSKSSAADYTVNAHTDMPSCIVELGFITDEEDNRLFDENLAAYAAAIAEAAAAFIPENLR